MMTAAVKRVLLLYRYANSERRAGGVAGSLICFWCVLTNNEAVVYSVARILSETKPTSERASKASQGSQPASLFFSGFFNLAFLMHLRTNIKIWAAQTSANVPPPFFSGMRGWDVGTFLRLETLGTSACALVFFLWRTISCRYTLSSCILFSDWYTRYLVVKTTWYDP